MTDLKDYRDYCEQTLLRIMNTHSPSGYYKRIMPLIKELAEAQGAEVSMTRKGCAILRYEGKSHEKTVALAAHCDTLGVMVRSLGKNGCVNFTKIGGPNLCTLDGEYCTLITRDEREYTGTILSKSPSVHVYDDSAMRKRDEENMYIRLDVNAKTVEDLKALGISCGDYVCFDTKTTFTESGHVKSRFLDDKASVAAILTAMKYLYDKGEKPDFDTYVIFTVFEEVGHGASWLPEGISELLAVDMGCIGLDLTCTEYDVSICVKDSSGPYDYEMTRRLMTLAEKNGISYAADVYPHYGSDVGAALRAGYDVKGALIGTGVHASHGMERTHMDGMKNTIALIIAYLTQN